jgi:uncharacterized protein (TIGR00251 family)
MGSGTPCGVLKGPAPWFRWRDDDLLLELKVQPRASRTEFADIHGDRLKVRIAAPPVDGEANAELIAFLAKKFGVARRQVSVLRGESGRTKTVCIRNPDRLPSALCKLAESDYK